jgi:L-seryl-tRNA(Ser) seleniumtransferase
MPDFSVIPSIDELLRRPVVRALETRYGSAATLAALRGAAADMRRAITAGQEGVGDATAVVSRIEGAATARLGEMFRPSLEPVINATGVIIHTNLGRAPLAAAAIARVAEVAAGYCTLEYDVGLGARGRRDAHAEPLVCRLTGAEAGVVVNNNAAATLVTLAALAAGREVVVSRGELVEIGGGFRVPDVMRTSGAQLREVGTTNKTRASDYAAAVTNRTALLLRVHPSNFKMEGFTDRPTLHELVAVGKRLNVPVAEDLGSGLFEPEREGGTAAQPDPVSRVEPSVASTIAAGVDVCCFSGDKLLGGPQAGIIVGRASLLERIRRHPLMRALRVDKMTYAALEATLAEYTSGRAESTVPVRRMLAMSADEIRERADRLAGALGRRPDWHAEIVPGVSAVGGGSAPGVDLPTWLVAVTKTALSPDALIERLRGLQRPVIARIHDDRVTLDLRTVAVDQDAALLNLLCTI